MLPARAWGGGDVASADGLRSVVPVRTIHSGRTRATTARSAGVTFYKSVSDQFTGLNGITVPGTLRDSLTLLSVVLEQQTELQPTEIMSDTGAYTDTIFRIFHLVGYQFSPRLADIGALGPGAWTAGPTTALSTTWPPNASAPRSLSGTGRTCCAWPAP